MRAQRLVDRRHGEFAELLRLGRAGDHEKPERQPHLASTVRRATVTRKTPARIMQPPIICRNSNVSFRTITPRGDGDGRPQIAGHRGAGRPRDANEPHEQRDRNGRRRQAERQHGGQVVLDRRKGGRSRQNKRHCERDHASDDLLRVLAKRGDGVTHIGGERPIACPTGITFKDGDVPRVHGALPQQEIVIEILGRQMRQAKIIS